MGSNEEYLDGLLESMSEESEAKMLDEIKDEAELVSQEKLLDVEDTLTMSQDDIEQLLQENDRSFDTQQDDLSELLSSI